MNPAFSLAFVSVISQPLSGCAGAQETRVPTSPVFVLHEPLHTFHTARTHLPLRSPPARWVLHDLRSFLHLASTTTSGSVLSFFTAPLPLLVALSHRLSLAPRRSYCTSNSACLIRRALVVSPPRAPIPPLSSVRGCAGHRTVPHWRRGKPLHHRGWATLISSFVRVVAARLAMRMKIDSCARSLISDDFKFGHFHVFFSLRFSDDRTLLSFIVPAFPPVGADMAKRLECIAAFSAHLAPGPYATRVRHVSHAYPSLLPAMNDIEKGKPGRDTERHGPAHEAAAAKLRVVYVSEAEKYDKGLVESWKSDMKGMLIFHKLLWEEAQTCPQIDAGIVGNGREEE
ncbi:hypothetical protein DFH09DRAFT_1315646 [Mycena vulgaris]|nr:hypothetical protein DFH09DRAFT_1315646 [Mycena vulgaris]